MFTSSQSDSVGSDSFQYMQSDLRLRPVSFCSSIIIIAFNHINLGSTDSIKLLSIRWLQWRGLDLNICEWIGWMLLDAIICVRIQMFPYGLSQSHGLLGLTSSHSDLGGVRLVPVGSVRFARTTRSFLHIKLIPNCFITLNRYQTIQLDSTGFHRFQG